MGYNMKTLNAVIAKSANVNLEAYEALLVRGMKPTKALYRLGVEQQLAGILGTLKLAVTEEEINEVYANSSIKSCMTGVEVGEFYSRINIAVIHSDRYRCLVSLDLNWKSKRGYGILCYQLDNILNQVLETSYLNLSDLVNTHKEIKVLHGKFNIQNIFPKDIFVNMPYLDSIYVDEYRNAEIESTQESTIWCNISKEVESTALNDHLDLWDIMSHEILWSDFEKTIENSSLVGSVYLGIHKPTGGELHRGLENYLVVQDGKVVSMFDKYSYTAVYESTTNQGVKVYDLEYDLPF